MNKQDRQLVEVRARAPLRLGLAGGGTDLSPYCDRFGGAVLNATIDRFVFAHIRPNSDGMVAFRARDIEQEESIAVGEALRLDRGLMLHKAVYKAVADSFLGGVGPAVTVTTTSDAPAGSGLGASSAIVVVMLEAFRVALGLDLDPMAIGRMAYHIERVTLGLAGGRQDQYAAAIGGINYMEFGADEHVVISPMMVPRRCLNELEASLIVCFTGQSRVSADIVKEQVASLTEKKPDALTAMHEIKDGASLMRAAILQGDIREVSRTLTRSWNAKRRTASGVDSLASNALFEVAMAAGAWGGKISGAGGGGFLMLCTDPEERYPLIGKLNSAGGRATTVNFTFGGAEGWIINR